MKKLYFFGILALLLFGAVFASCKKDDGEEIIIIDGDTFLENLKAAPVQIASRNTLPGWLVAEMEMIDEMASQNPLTFNAQIYIGEWDRRIVYFIRHGYQSCIFCSIYYEDGEKIEWDVSDHTEYDHFLSTSKNWVLIYEIVGDFNTRNGLIENKQKKIIDQFEFPIKPGTTEWSRFESISARIEALQIPDAMLATISTGGGETCLNFPYLIDILL